MRWKADRNNSPPNPSVPPQARPSSDPFRRQNLPPAKTAPNSWLPALPPRWLNCRRWQRRLNPNQPPRLEFFFGHLGRFSAVSGNHRPSLLELLAGSSNTVLTASESLATRIMTVLFGSMSRRGMMASRQNRKRLLNTVYRSVVPLL